jgi:hypothetical protein
MLAFTAAAAAGQKPTPSSRGSNPLVTVEARLYADRESVKQVIGNDLGGYYVVVDVKLEPLKKLKVERDDFQLRTDRDGERSKPFGPTQVAGKGVLVVSQTGSGGGMMAEDRSPIWGGIGGGYPGGGSGIGSAASTISNESRLDTGAKSKEDPVLAVLKQKVLPEKETEEPVGGLLYFPMEPKQKVKDLELTYTTPSGKIVLRFK